MQLYDLLNAELERIHLALGNGVCVSTETIIHMRQMHATLIELLRKPEGHTRD